MNELEKISISSSSDLLEVIDTATHNANREKAVHYMFSEGANSCGKELKDVINLVRESALKNDDNKENPNLAQITNKIVADTRGRTGEFLSKPLDVGDCMTLYGRDVYVPKHELIDPNDYFKNNGGPRKDIVLLNYFFETEADEVSSTGLENNKLSPEEILTIKDATLYVYNNQREVSRSWKSANPDMRSGVGSAQLVRWYLHQNSQTPNGEKGKQQNKLIDRALAYIDHRDDEFGNIMGRKTTKTLLESRSEPAYPAAALPDMLLVSPENKITGIIEVKSYTPEEVKLWIASLKESVEAENNSADPEGKGLYDAARYDRRGLQVNLIDKEMGKPLGMRLGINLDSARNFINAANIELPHSGLMIDTIDNMTFEVFPEHIECPVILRLPQDTSKEDIRELGEILDELKLRGVVIQQLPFSSAELNEGGHAALMKSYFDLPKEERTKLNDIHPDLTVTLGDRKTWGLPEKENNT